MLTREHIVVGVSRTPPGAAALRWALDAASAQGWEVLAVHTFDTSVRADAAMERDLEAEARASAHRAQMWVQQIAANDEARRLVRVPVLRGRDRSGPCQSSRMGPRCSCWAHPRSRATQTCLLACGNAATAR